MSASAPYSFTESLNFKLSLAIICSIFIYLFLVFYQPFGVNNYKPQSAISSEQLLELALLIPVSFIIIFCSEYFIRPLLINGTTLKQLIPWYLIEFILLGSGTFMAYNFMGDFHDFYFTSYLQHVAEVGSILLFPFLATFFLFRFRSMAKRYQEVLTVSQEISRLNEIVLISGDYKKDEIAINNQEIVYIASEDNYAGINYIEGGQLKKHLVRSTLSKMEKLFPSALMVRCHRSYIVNLHQLTSYRIVSNQLELKLNQADMEIPVSKSYKDQILEIITKHSL